MKKETKTEKTTLRETYFLDKIAHFHAEFEIIHPF